MELWQSFFVNTSHPAVDWQLTVPKTHARLDSTRHSRLLVMMMMILMVVVDTILWCCAETNDLSTATDQRQMTIVWDRMNE